MDGSATSRHARQRDGQGRKSAHDPDRQEARLSREIEVGFPTWGRQISANISDSEWLAAFQSRKIDVRPGDALRCLVNIEHHYGYDNELITETYIVTKVVEVLENQISQREMEL